MMTCEDQFFLKDEERKKGRFIEGVGCNVHWVEVFSEEKYFFICVKSWNGKYIYLQMWK